MHTLNSPYAGGPATLLVDGERRHAIARESLTLPSMDINARQLHDLELLISGALSPLTGYMSSADYNSVLDGQRLPDGTFWPLPITLDVATETAKSLQAGTRIALRDPEGCLIAVLAMDEVWRADKEREALALYGTTKRGHPGIDRLFDHGSHYISGSLEGVALPIHHDFTALRFTPALMRAFFTVRGWQQVIAFPTCQPMHRAHYEFTLGTATDLEANLLITALP
ncbi:MAG: hypothetical protein ACREUA_03370, partial [Burkholderiales bacterium]